MKIRLKLGIIVFVIFLIGCTNQENNNHDDSIHETEFHIHADFKVYIHDEVFDFSQMMYQLRAREVHVEDSVGDVVHVHQREVTVGHFLETLGGSLSKDCIQLPLQEEYCTNDESTLQFYVNGFPNDFNDQYVVRDLDKILITYGDGNIEEQLQSITDLAFEHSEVKL